jgi:PhnB protein
MAAKEIKIVPYLTVSNAHKALDFYKAGLGAKITSKMPAEDGKRLMHSEAVINGHSIYVCDEFPEHGGKGGPEKIGGSPVYMHVNVKRPKDVDVWMDRAAKAGAKVTMPAADMFWGDRYGRIVDPFGHDWGFGAALPKPKKKAKAKAAAKAAKAKPKGKGKR